MKILRQGQVQVRVKTVTVQQPCYLGSWPGALHKTLTADLHVIFDTCSMPDKGFERRNYVKGTLLSVPCMNKRAPIKDVLIDNSSNWNEKHFRTIRQAYGKSEHWKRYSDHLEYVYSTEWTHLCNLNVQIAGLISHDIEGADVPHIWASHLSIDPSLTGPARVIEILKTVNADRFIVGEGARPYTPVDELARLGIETVFESYPQFTPGVSMLDVLMEHGPGTREYILGEM